MRYLIFVSLVVSACILATPALAQEVENATLQHGPMIVVDGAQTNYGPMIVVDGARANYGPMIVVDGAR